MLIFQSNFDRYHLSINRINKLRISCKMSIHQKGFINIYKKSINSLKITIYTGLLVQLHLFFFVVFYLEESMKSYGSIITTNHKRHYNNLQMKVKKQPKIYMLILMLSIISVQSFSIIDRVEYFTQKYSGKSFALLLPNFKKSDLNNIRHGANQTILKDNLKGNLLIVDNYALIPQNNDEYPQIIRLNLQTAQLQTLKYPKVSNWQQYRPTAISDLKNGDLCYGVSSNLLILDKKTLALKQMITLSDQYGIFFKCHVFIDEITNERRMLAEVGWNNPTSLYQLKQDQLGTYSLQLRSFLLGGPESDLDFQMTGINTGVIVRWSNITYFQNFNGVIDQSLDRKYFLYARQRIAVTYDESMFVARTDNSFYQFYLLDENYDFKLKQRILISYNQHRKAEFTTDDKYLFVSMSNPRKIHNIAKVIVEENEFIFVTDSDGISDNHIDFNLFSRETDRMIVLALKGATYVLQLRTISTLAIIHELPLKFNFTLLNIKLAGNVQWGLSFAIAAQFPTNYTQELNAYLYQFIVSGDKISQTGLMGRFIFENLQTCYKYFISYKPYPSRSFNVYHSSNFTLAKMITQWSSFDLFFQKNIVLVGRQQLQLYDFSKSLDYQGVVFVKQQQLSIKFSFIFAKRGVYLQITTREHSARDVMRIIYNISLPAANKVVRFEDEWSFIHSEQYYQAIEKGACNKVYYIWKKPFQQVYNISIVQYDECSNNKIEYPYSNQQAQLVKLFVSSDRRYLITFLSISTKEIPFSGYWVDIREQKNLSASIFLKSFQFGQLSNRSSFSQLKGDLIKGSQLIIKSNNFIMIESIQSTNNSQGKAEQINL